MTFNNNYLPMQIGGWYYHKGIERRNGTGLLVPPRSPEGGLRWRNISDLGGVG